MLKVNLSSNAGWSYVLAEHTIFAEPIQDRFDLASLLHEMGHAHWKHGPVCLPDYPKHIQHEVDAWIYAFRALENPLPYVNFALWCIATHCAAVGFWFRHVNVIALYESAKKALEKEII